MTTAYWNGSLCPLCDVAVSPFDRGFLFGDGVYEVIKVAHGKPWKVGQHLTRLNHSLAGLQLNGIDTDQLATQIELIIAANQVNNGMVYLQVSRGNSGQRTHAFPAPDTKPSILIYAKEILQPPLAAFEDAGIGVILHPDERWAKRYIKSINLLPNCLAKQAAQARGKQEAILVDPDGTITEGSSSNVFMVSEGVLYTRPLDGRILPGITRAHVLTLAQELNLPITEIPFSKETLLAADEVFITGTLSDIAIVTSIDDTLINSTPTITKQIIALRATQLNQQF